ncbi:unannotated protein [freshwater metagenome]|uniref:Unannotated protein n=1 Tax=freshwater metagenome TaxID=449393 RepID=A0A6J6BY70_9ZZZZ
MPSVTNNPRRTIRATQKKRMSYPVTKTLVGKNFARSSVLSGQPKVENGHKPEENQVSRTSGSWTYPAGGVSSGPHTTTSPFGP